MIASFSTATTRREALLLPPGAVRIFVLVTGLLFLWSILNNLNDVLIRQFMKSFALSRFQAGLVHSAFYLGYFLVALPAEVLMRHKGYKGGFNTGLVLFSAGCFLFWAAARSGHYAAFLLALFVVASGLAFLETAANPFIAQLGPSSSSEACLNLAQAFNPVGAILGAWLGTSFIFCGIELTPAQVTVTSFFMSVMFPTIFAMGLKNLGPTPTRRFPYSHDHHRRRRRHTTDGSSCRANTQHRCVLLLSLFGYVVVGFFAIYMSGYTRWRMCLLNPTV